MDCYNKIRKIFEIQELVKKRLIQLKDEEKIDSYLLTKCNCSSEIVKYFANMRELNRLHTQKINSVSFIDCHAHMESAYSDIEKIHSIILGLNNTDCCNLLLPFVNNHLETKVIAEQKTNLK